MHTDAHLGGGDLEHTLLRHHGIGALEQDRNTNEGFGLGLTRVLHRRDDGEVGDHTTIGHGHDHALVERDGIDAAHVARTDVGAITHGANLADDLTLQQALHPQKRGGRRVVDIGEVAERVEHRDVILSRHDVGIASAGARRGIAGRHEGDDVVDATDSLIGGLKRGFNAHARSHCALGTGVDNVEHRCVGTIKRDECEREWMLHRVQMRGLRHPGPGGHGALGADLDVVGA